MTLNLRPSTLNQLNALFFPLCVLGCYWLLLIYQLGAQWSVYEQYNYGWAVPFLCGYLLWLRNSPATARPAGRLFSPRSPFSPN
ncbi:MAG: hypothetical protein ABSD29_25740 [Verrucomicrobiota bacterium]